MLLKTAFSLASAFYAFSLSFLAEVPRPSAAWKTSQHSHSHRELMLDSSGLSSIFDGTHSCPSDILLDKAVAVCLALDNHWAVSSLTDLGGFANEHGAFSKNNVRFDETGEQPWFIEEQQYGIMFVQAGLAFDNTKAIDVGLQIFNWGFEQQQEDGSFNNPDRYHSSGFFMESTARAALLLNSSFYKDKYEPWIRDKAFPHLTKLANWFLLPETDSEGWERDAPHAHRRYLTGLGLGLVGKLASVLTGNRTFVRKAWKYIKSGIEKQDPSGFNYEKGGYDCSYQGKGLGYAARFYLDVANTEKQRWKLRKMGRRGAAWLLTRIDSNGVLNVTGNTRTGGLQETGRNGEFKAVAKGDVVQALLYWGWILGDEALTDAAWRVERERTGAPHRPCLCRLDVEGRWVQDNVKWCKENGCANAT